MKKTTTSKTKKPGMSESAAQGMPKEKDAVPPLSDRTIGKLAPDDAVNFLKAYEKLLGNEADQLAFRAALKRELASEEIAKTARAKKAAGATVGAASKPADSPVGSESRKFASVMRKMRRLQELSQEDLAEKAGLHRNFVGAVERGEMSVSLENAERLANALGVKLKDLL